VASLDQLIGDSPGLVAVRTQVEQLLRRRSQTRRLPPILILGETGTGKGLLARAIHEAGPRRAGPFVAVNCAAIPETLLEAELFGFERGAFTDAHHAKAGLFHTAHRGTLFLDEIGLLPENLQAKLLTVLEDRAVRRLGSTRTEAVDVWVISATSEDLKAGARRPRFREELYHRLAVVTLRLPPLRERGKDILKLAEHFLAHTCTEYGLAPKTLAEDARAALVAYRWPGNVREVANVMERVALLTDAPVLTAHRLELAAPPGRPASPPQGRDTTPPDALEGMSLEETVERLERVRILEALHKTRWNISRAASLLGVTRHILRYRLRKYGLRSPAETTEPTLPAEPESLAVEPATAPRTLNVQWERRHAALLRADLVTALPAGVALDAASMLDALVEKIQSFGGQVEEVSAHGLVGVFGLEPIEDAPRRAAHAALAIQKVAAHASAASTDVLGVRLGLDVGEVLVARVGSSVRVDYEAKRAALAHLEGFMRDPEPGTILMSEATRPFLERRFIVAPFTTSERELTRAYRLEGLERTGLGLGEQLTPLVARGSELGQLAQALKQAETGHGQVVAVVGEAGVGKSRLFWEFIDSQRNGDALILISTAASYGKATPYVPVIDLLKGYFRIEPRDDTRKIETRVAAKLGQALAPALSPILALLDTPLDDAQWRGLDHHQKRRQTLEAMKLLVIGESHVQPVIVVLEDVHWVDSETQAVLDTLIESLPSHRVLLLISYRPEYEHGWSNKSCYTQLRLDPLSPDEARSLLDSLVSRDGVTAALKAELIDRTGGNPFFLEESVRTLVETGALIGERGAYRLMGPTADIQVPATVQAVLAARIDRLPPEDKTLLQTAAVIGKDMSLALLRAVAHLPEESLRASLTRLQRSEFLHETRLVPELEYTFKHALTHDVAYQSLFQERRKALHARVVEAIEQLSGGNLAEQAETLARHALSAEIWKKAVDYLRIAGAQAYAKGALLDGLARYERAREVLPRLPKHPDNLRVAIDVRLDFHLPLFALGRLARLTELHQEAEQLARQLHDQPRLGAISARLAAYSLMNAQYRQGTEYARETLSIATATDDPELRVLGTVTKGMNHAILGEYRPAIDLLLRVVEGPDAELAKRLPAGYTFAYLGACGWLAQCMAFVGDFERATTYGDHGVQAAAVVDQPLAQAYASLWRAIPSCVQGEFAEALEWAERACCLCETKGLAGLLPYACYILGWALAGSGRLIEGLVYLERGVTLVENLELRVHRSWSHVLLAEALLIGGHTQRAKGVAARGLEMAQAHRERGFETWARCMLGAIAAAGAPPDLEVALTSYTQAKALAEELGMRPLAAHCHRGLGKLYGKTGRPREAQEHLMTATALYREMDMPFWLEQAEAGVAELR